MRTARHPSAFALFALLLCATTAIPSSAQSYTTLVDFNVFHGTNPASTLVQGADGNFYGTSRLGGVGGGTVFKMSPGGKLTLLHSFGGKNGAYPLSGLVQGTDGNFYGTTSQGGIHHNCSNIGLDGCGSIFKITPSGTATSLYSFDGSDGAYLVSGLVLAIDGNFYGTTYEGGNLNCLAPHGCGTVFRITPAGDLTTVHTFNGSDGYWPEAGLVQGADGNLYGTTFYGGTTGNGTVFRITSGTLTTLYNFCSQPNCTDGWGPRGQIAQGTDGNFYGTTASGGIYNDCVDLAGTCGTVFRITPAGVLTTLHSFDNSDGANPNGLMQATDGNFYGTTLDGGDFSCDSLYGCGTVFEITPSGVLTTLHVFAGADGADGAFPKAQLVQATSGKFFGTTHGGGNPACQNTSGCGTAFRVSTGVAPFVTLQPTSGQVGSSVTIVGLHLSGATSVAFNGTPATILTNTDSAITTTVPAGATTGNVRVTVAGSTLISNTDFQVVGAMQYVPVTPCRLVDTRQNGGHPIQGGTSESFTISQLGGCNIPTSAAAYALNISVVPHGTLGALVIWPQGEIQPFISTMGSPDGRVKAHAAIVPAGNNAVSVYVSDTTDVILDIEGYFSAPGALTYQFYPVTPCRLVDTRKGSGGPLQAGVERDYTIAGNCGIPSTATAYSFNVTVLPTNGELDYLTVWPKGESRPAVSTLSDPTGTAVANAVIVPAGADGATAFYAHDNTTNLLLDVNGYFAAPGSAGLSLYPVTPCRVLDTSSNVGPFEGTLTVNVVDSVCAPPSSAQAYVFNAIVEPPGSMPYLTLWAHGTTQPSTETLSAADGFVTSNMAIVATNDGSIDAYAAGLTQLILDISGYFAK